MRRLLILPLIIMIISSCKKSSETAKPVVLDNATYKGTFQRKLDTYGNISNVQLNFSSGKFSGASDQGKYPGICNGTFSIRGDSIEFMNACVWTAEFDWSLILGGRYAVKQNGNDLRLSRKYMNGKYEDVYLLTKQ